MMDDPAGSVVVQKALSIYKELPFFLPIDHTYNPIVWYLDLHKFVLLRILTRILTRKKAPRFVLPFVSFWIIVAWLTKRQNALKFGKVSALREFLVKISKRRTRENSRPTCCVNINSVTPRASYHLSHSSAVLYVTLLFASIHQI